MILEEARSKNPISGCHINRNHFDLNYLLFADDILLFSTTDIGKIQNLRIIISSFKKASGLKISLQKSSLAGINVTSNFIQQVKGIWDCSISGLPFFYLGMPLGGNPKTAAFWYPIIEKIEKKFVAWKYSYILKREGEEGRLTLVQVVLSNLPTYYVSLFQAPICVCKTIKKPMRDFLWEGTKKNGASHLVRWDIVIAPKSIGGLGSKKLKLPIWPY